MCGRVHRRNANTAAGVVLPALWRTIHAARRHRLRGRVLKLRGDVQAQVVRVVRPGALRCVRGSAVIFREVLPAVQSLTRRALVWLALATLYLFISAGFGAWLCG